MSEIEKSGKSNLLVINKLDLLKALFENWSDKYSNLELIISIEDSGININELSSYLNFIYKADGHLSAIGYSKYVRNPATQIEISQVRFGSWEIVIERILDSGEATRLILLFLSIKFLPKFVQTLGDGIQKYYQTMSTREDYLDKKEKRKSRKKVRELVNQEEWLSSLDKNSKEKIVNLVDEIFRQNNKKLAPASRFARKSVKGLRIEPKTDNGNDE